MWKTNIWSCVFGLLTFSAALGVLVHGFKIPEALYHLLWQPLFLALGFTVALFVLGACYDAWGLAATRRILPVMLIIAIAFYAVTLIFPGTFLVFILYEAIAMTFALFTYGRLALRKRLNGAGLMTAGILISIIAAGFQASTGISIKLIWEFDHNGIFHLIQTVGVLFLIAGLRASMCSE